MPQVTMDNRAVQAVAALKPGECIEVDMKFLAKTLPGFYHKNAYFSPADRVLENIMGSGYEFHYTVNEFKGTVTFCRLKEPIRDGQGCYVSPDRR